MHRKTCLILIMISFTSILGSCTYLHILYHNFSTIEDYNIFPGRELKKSANPFQFTKVEGKRRLPQTIPYNEKQLLPLDQFLEKTDTVAFLVVKNDQLIFEHYAEGYNRLSQMMVFSVTKSVFSILIGKAIEDGYLSSESQPITDFIPELKDHGFEEVTIHHLLQMTSGMDYKESDNPFGIHVWFYHHSKIIRDLLKLRLKHKPGTVYNYKSGDTQLLGLALSRALGEKTITGYLQETIWEPLGMEYNGLWNIYEDGLEKVFCCLSARAVDLAKIGRLYLHEGKWQGRQILPRQWVKDTKKLDTSFGSAWFYQKGWYFMSERYQDFRAEGVRGQFIYVNPVKDLVVVRIGKSRGGLSWDQWRELFTYFAENVN